MICWMMGLMVLFGSTRIMAQPAIDGKEIYIPKELRHNDFNNPESDWSYSRMALTENVVLFWEKGFGDDLSKAPNLEGKPMTVNKENLLERVEQFYKYFRDTLQFIRPGSKADKYRMMVMLKYSLEGTAYGGDYDGTIGALWITPNRVQDKKLNCIAHELGHSFQSQLRIDNGAAAMGGIYEMTSQWMLWQVNPVWTHDERYHWEAFSKAFHLRFLAGENIYRSPYVLEYMAMKHGITEIAELWRDSKRGEDFAATYIRHHGLTINQMNDEMADCYSRLITFDFPRIKELHRDMVGQLASSPEDVPQTYGFNVREIPVQGKKSVKVHFRSTCQDNNSGHRYQLVGVDAQGNATYYGIQSKPETTLKWKQQGKTEHLYLMVMGCPTKEYNSGSQNPRGRKQSAEKTYPYEITID